MLRIVEDFVRMVGKPGPGVLIVAGVAAVLLGLFIWLGGLGFRKALVAIVGAAAGLLCAFVFIGRGAGHLVLSAVGGVALALLLEKVFLTLLASALAGVATIIGFAAYYEVDFGISMRYAIGQLPAQAWIAAAALAAGFIFASFYIWRFVSAVACSALGTVLVFAGMILLLSHKGAEPIKALDAKPLLYAGVFGVMTAFGTVVQLLVCPREKKVKVTKIEPKKQAPEPAPEPEKKRLDWRMH
ncbi:MAG: hypothetical protein ACYST6_10035 [Planctomycetota bacterium]|jgi:hypothetical protein